VCESGQVVGTARKSRSTSRRALTLYVVGWLAAGTLVGGALLVAVGGGDGDPDVSLPPVRQTELSVAAASAGCLLRAGSSRRRDEPPVDGGRAPAAAAGYYESAPPAARLVGAMRRGVVVISYRPEVAEEHRERLRALQRAAPAGTIVVPYPGMRFAIAVTAWHRLLGCRRIGAGTLDALDSPQ